EQAVGEQADFAGQDDADAFERGRVVPRVVEKTDAPIRFRTFRLGNLQSPADGRLAHRLVRAERDQDVERFGRFANLPIERLEQQPDRRGACAVGNDDQNFLVAVIFGGAGLSYHIGNLFAVETAACGGGFVDGSL